MMSRLLIVLLGLSAFYALVDGDWVSVDCGYSGDSYFDDNRIFWSGDDGLFKKSESIAIPTNSVSEPMRTLTVFTPEYKKNCYYIPQDKGQKVLVRASFYYGNYDKKSSPPTFDLQFEGNHWEKVVTSIDQVVTYEAIYVTKTNGVNVCLAQLFPNQFAFISALEVVPLEMSMYNYVSSDTALFLKARVPCGSKETIRYSTDSYDRIWTPVTGGDGLLATTYDGIFIDTSTLPDVAPPEVLLNAFTTSDTSTSIELGSLFPPDPTSLHINMYFSEVTELEPTQTRSFKIFINNEEKSDPIVPVYGEAAEKSYTNFTASSSTSFSLVATETSTLPPLLNAFEIFTISDTLSDGTYSADVDGVFALVKQFDSLREWSGEPCLPLTYTWDWLNCTTDLTPRITALYLSSFNLSGELPDFSGLSALETIDMQNNSLKGSIPDFLGTLPNLKLLNLADNHLSGPIPSSISENTNLKLVVTGNPDLCVSSKPCKQVDTSTDSDGYKSTGSDGYNTNKRRNSRRVILGTVIPIFVLFWIVIIVLVVLHQKRKAALVLNYARQNPPAGGPQQETGGFAEMVNNGMGMEASNENITDSSYQNQQGGV